MTDHFWLAGHYFDLSQIIAIRQHMLGGATVYLRSGATMPVSKVDEANLIGGFKQWQKSQDRWLANRALAPRDRWAETRALRPNPGTDKADNGLHDT